MKRAGLRLASRDGLLCVEVMMKMYQALILCVFLGSGSVMADTDLEIVNKAMGGLEQVSDDEKLYIATGTDDFTLDNDMVDSLRVSESKIYITSDKAKEDGLIVTKTFHIYAFMNINQLDEKIAQHIDADDPTFFSVDLYKNRVGDDNLEQFVAKVIEYR